MLINGRIFCNFCQLEIGLQKYRILTLANKTYHFHNREQGDCFEKQLNKIKEKLKKEAV